MSITKAVLKRIRVCAGLTYTGIGDTAEIIMRSSIGFMFAALLVLSVSRSAIAADPLGNAVDNIDTDATMIGTKNAAVLKDVTALAARTNAGVCPLLVIGNSLTNSAPVYFTPGPTPAVVLQADIIVGPGITITGISPGPVATAAGKSIQSSPIPGGERFILLGLNQTPIGPGSVATVNFDLTGASVGPHIIALTNFVAGDTAANDIPMCVTTGVITK